MELFGGCKLVSLFVIIFCMWRQVASEARIDCFPEPGANQEGCLARKCAWKASQVVGEPWCYFTNTTGYRVTNSLLNFTVTLAPAVSDSNPYYPNLAEIKFEASFIGKTLNVRIFADGRYEPPVKFPKIPSTSTETLHIFRNNDGPGGTFAFKVLWESNSSDFIWDTSIGGLLFGDQYIQIATYLPSENIFGFGEHIHKKIKHNMTRYTTWPMFTRDIGPDSVSELSTTNLYGVHPFYMGFGKSKKAYGVLILNSNAQEVTLGTGPHLVYRTIGGILDLYFFPGPTPNDVVQQYHSLIGFPILPAYWALGFQLSRWGYKDLDDMISAVNRTVDADIPLEIVVCDIEYMDRYKDFTLGWEGLTNYTEKLHEDGMHVTLITDPGIQVNYPTFERAMLSDARFVEWPNASYVDQSISGLYPLLNGTNIMPGNVWPDNNTAMPDFLDPSNNTRDWWLEEYINFKNNSVDFDNIWIDMNEPSNFDTDPIVANAQIPLKVDAKYRLKCPVDGDDAKYDNPNYQTFAVYGFGDVIGKNHTQGNYLFTKTLCMMGKIAGGEHILYNTHSIYGLSMAMVTSETREIFNNRAGLISRSTFVSSGHYTGHWLGDNSATWGDLQTSVIGAQEVNIFGMTYTGSDICGFNRNTTEELCLRWHQMGAFHPFCRNHNAAGNIPQDPAQWSRVADAARKAISFRYFYLPYLNTLMYEASVNGGTVIRPLFFEFPQDETTYECGNQFMWGRGMMIIPVVEEGVVEVSAYIPEDTWYSLRDGDEYGRALPKGASYQTFSAKLDEMIPVLARGGVIIVRQPGAAVLRDARENPFSLLIPLKLSDGLPAASDATGTLFWDDGEHFPLMDFHYISFTFSFTYDLVSLNISKLKSGNVSIPSLSVIEVFGYPIEPDFTTTTLNGVTVTVNGSYDNDTKILSIDLPQAIELLNDSLFTWKNVPIPSPPAPPSSSTELSSSSTEPPSLSTESPSSSVEPPPSSKIPPSSTTAPRPPSSSTVPPSSSTTKPSQGAASTMPPTESSPLTTTTKGANGLRSVSSHSFLIVFIAALLFR